MGSDDKLEAFKRRLLLFPPLFVALISLPMALRVVAPNRVYGFRTPTSLASPAAWYRSNFAAGATGVALGLAGALLVYVMLKRRPLTPRLALAAGGVGVFAAVASAAAGVFAC